LKLYKSYTVPVCIDTKHPQALYDDESHSPETKQHAMMGISAWLNVMSVLRWFRAVRKVESFVDEPLGLFSLIGKVSDSEEVGSRIGTVGIVVVVVIKKSIIDELCRNRKHIYIPLGQ
jgi:hypothetical protein